MNGSISSRSRIRRFQNLGLKSGLFLLKKSPVSREQPTYVRIALIPCIASAVVTTSWCPIVVVPLAVLDCTGSTGPIIQVAAVTRRLIHTILHTRIASQLVTLILFHRELQLGFASTSSSPRPWRTKLM